MLTKWNRLGFGYPRAKASGSRWRALQGVRLTVRCRVALGGRPPRAPTDPDVQLSCIRLVRSTLHTWRYTEWTTRAAGSGIRPSKPHRLAQPKRPFQLRRESHFRQIRATIPRIRLSEEPFPVTP
jgi:hypothetical protein